MTTMERTLEREMIAIGYLIEQQRPLRLKDFDPLINRYRVKGDKTLFPLGRTTLKSALNLAVKGKLIRAERLQVGNRMIVFYTPRQKAYLTYAAWKGQK